MNHSDIAALMKGAAPAIRDFVASAMDPLVKRIGELERELEAVRAVDHGQAIKAAVAEAVAKAVAELPPPANGKDADPELIAQMVKDAVSSIQQIAQVVDPAAIRSAVAEAVAALPPAEPGKDAEPPTLAELRALIGPMVDEAVASLPPPADGKSVTIDELAPLVEEVVSRAVAALPVPKDGAPGKLPIAKAWADRVHYEAEVATHEGALWQATKDTGREPGDNDDWICLAVAGAPGRDADQIEIRGTYDPGKAATYSRLNIVALNGGAFIAKMDDPGECPGDGWQMIASRGKPGQPGQSIKGDPGPSIKGPPGAPAADLSINAEGLLTLTNGDGSRIECDLYPVLSRL